MSVLILVAYHLVILIISFVFSYEVEKSENSNFVVNFKKCFGIKKTKPKHVLHFGVYQDFFCVRIDI